MYGCTIRQQIRSFIGYKVIVMEEHGKVYTHYNHSDSCRFFRWTARESFRFMYDRPWQDVNHFYSNVVNGRSSLLDLFSSHHLQRSFIHDTARSQEVTSAAQFEDVLNEGKSGRWERVTFKLVLSYHGISFDGWQKQPGLSTVQRLIESSLGKFVDEKKAQLLKDKHKPLEGCAVVAGRTDKGVSALGQVCSFYTWRKDVKPHDIEDAINSAAPGKIRVTSVSKVSRVFHPNFSAKWRRYLYIFPFSGGEYRGQNFETQENAEDFSYDENCYDVRNECGETINEENFEHAIILDKDELGEARKPMTFSVCRVNRLLQQLEGKLLSYKVFARDTKASRNMGPATECFVHHARAKEARLPSSDQGEGRKVMCVELVANRFLRKMVRVLVATSIREAAAGAEEDVLLKLMDATSRRATAPPAPPDGLCLVDVGYTEFDPQSCIIP